MYKNIWKKEIFGYLFYLILFNEQFFQLFTRSIYISIK